MRWRIRNRKLADVVMRFTPGEIYHVYNRGNNRQPIFFKEDNYHYFLQKIRKELLNDCVILAYCLMPNHYHLLLLPNEKGCALHSEVAGNHIQSLSYKIGSLQSSYTRAINKDKNRTGSLFQQKTKAKQLIPDVWPGLNTTAICLHYIHQNPLKAGLVGKLEDWQFSSFKDYAKLRQGTLCNQKLAVEIANINLESFVRDSYGIMCDDVFEKIF